MLNPPFGIFIFPPISRYSLFSCLFRGEVNEVWTQAIIILGKSPCGIDLYANLALEQLDSHTRLERQSQPSSKVSVLQWYLDGPCLIFSSQWPRFRKRSFYGCSILISREAQHWPGKELPLHRSIGFSEPRGAANAAPSASWGSPGSSPQSESPWDCRLRGSALRELSWKAAQSAEGADVLKCRVLPRTAVEIIVSAGSESQVPALNSCVWRKGPNIVGSLLYNSFAGFKLNNCSSICRILAKQGLPVQANCNGRSRAFSKG